MKRGIIIFISLFNWLIAYCQSDQQIKNLETFTKLYGYIKYFHPSDEAVGTDWDRFAIYGSKLVSEAKNADELINILNKLFKPIAPSILITKKENKIEFDLKTITPKDSINYKVIAWQHLGNGIDGTMKNTYRSIRLNRNNKEKSNKSEFGNLMTHISAIKYQGKKIKLTGDVKIKNGSSGKGHLWVRVDRKNRKTGFFDNMSNNPIIDNTWNEYEITGKIDDDADKIYFGCFFNGNGELYVDNLKLFYKEDKQWIEIPIDNNDFEKDKIGDKISFWQKSGDSYLIRIADKQDKNNKCVAIGKLSTDYLFSKYPKIGKVIDKDIGNGIRTIIPLALYGDILETYPPANKDELKQLKRNLSEIEKDNVNDLFVKLGDIVITWNIFQHFYPYFNETKTDWNKELLKALNRCFSCKTLVDFILNMEEFTAALKDGHISIRSKEISLDYSAPISWDWVEDKLVITKVLDTTLKVKVGDIVKRIDNIDPKIYFDSIERYISAANLSSLKWKSHLRSLTGEKNSKIKIELENGLVHELVKDTKSSELNKIKTQTGNKPNYRFYPDNITYLHIGLISMETIDSLLPKLTTSKAIICDLRGYP